MYSELADECSQTCFDINTGYEHCTDNVLNSRSPAHDVCRKNNFLIIIINLYLFVLVLAHCGTNLYHNRQCAHNLT